jgi:hypothetical protein
MHKTITFILCLALAFVLGAMTASAQSCAISSGLGHPLLPDTDCDGIVDMQDNCPYITNPVQRDADMNGLGDACDLYIESIRTNPADFVYNGRAFNTIVTLENNRDYNIRNMKVRVFVPELGIESVQYIDNINVCDAKTLEFMLRAPMCVPLSDYQIIVEASFLNEFGEREIIPGITSIRVVPDQHCQMVLDNNEIIGNTMIDVMEIQDVYKGCEAVFPIKIANMEANDKDYVFSVTGLDGWGSARLSPGSLVIVPKESEVSVNLYVKANDDASSTCFGSDCGSRSFVVTVQSGKEVQRFLLVANVKENPQQNNMFLWIFTFKVIIIIVLVVLIVIACVFAVRKLWAKIKQESATQYY